ncbi:MAG: glycosyltransferase [Prevotellaceae bacterium]|nr:glycosyltransferase [Prevotellaceae bacterium]MDY3855969.1 glycosyltransferase [Bacteroidaceae bacterium]
MDGRLDISVVMCTWNGVRFLQEQLDSILDQTYPVREIIVQDDGSTDGTWDLLKQYSRLHPLIRIYRNEAAHGINGNFFSAMARAQGDYIAISDQDDIWEPRKLEIQAQAIGDKMLCSARSVPFSTDGYPVKVDRRRPNTHLIRLAYICELPGHSMLFRRRLLDFIHDGEHSMLYYDTQILDVAAAAESIVYVDKSLVHFRRHAEAATASRPLQTRLLSMGALEYVWTSLIHHRRLQWEVRRRMMTVKAILEACPFDTVSRREALEMCSLQLKRGPWAALKRIHFFVRHSHVLFHADEPRSAVRWLRAIFFNWSCGYYYRAYIGQPKTT